MHGTKGSIDTALRQSYKDPLDDTDEDLSDVPSDYGGSKQTKKLKLRARDRWQRYCAAKASEPAADPQWFDAKEALQRASAKDLHRFWNWVLGKLERGKGGRKLKGTKKTSSLKSDWKYFQGYYRKVTGNGISEKMSEDVRRGMRSLADKHSLDNQPRENIPVYIEDMVPFNQTILRTREKRFHLGLQRLLLCFYNMLGLFTVNRESAILNLQYKDLLLSMQRDPHGGPPVPTVDFRPEFIKRNLGMGKLNTFVLPEIIFDVSLVFSPHVFLFGFLFHAEAFENSSLQSMEDVRKLVPADGCQEMPLPLKREMDNWYIFCKVDVQDGQVRFLRDTPMSAGTLDSQLKSMSEIHGFLNTFFSHQFRYGGGKLLDESGGIRIREDLIDLYTRTRDAALVPLLQERQREVSNTRRRLRDQLKHKVRREFSRKQAVIDIEHQLSGFGSVLDDEGAREVLRTEFEMPLAQIHLLEKLLTWPTSDSLDDEWRRRNEAVEAVRQYCGFLEGGPLRGRPKRAIPSDGPPSADIPPQKKTRQEGRPVSSLAGEEVPHSRWPPRPIHTGSPGMLSVWKKIHPASGFVTATPQIVENQRTAKNPLGVAGRYSAVEFMWEGFDGVPFLAGLCIYHWRRYGYMPSSVEASSMIRRHFLYSSERDVKHRYPNGMTFKHHDIERWVFLNTVHIRPREGLGRLLHEDKENKQAADMEEDFKEDMMKIATVQNQHRSSA
ncbi:predicted protein [Histoplasma mississippiense (nom. inval.)]|uniref:predicted protein n=1 Tax=Ajellomyces capsulatus (strain NAm1 / WU24) TaxID=2059318 RepID=UPI000157B5FB|nr:predicted protein [Histoplasma mississippiense (nom. inval.)]EDN02645.1 predicted protein [Histoplasma mississippiense (nom. inval.)]